MSDATPPEGPSEGLPAQPPSPPSSQPPPPPPGATDWGSYQPHQPSQAEPAAPPQKRTAWIVAGAVAVAVIVVVAVVGAVSGGGGHFSGHGVSFDYPNSWTLDQSPSLQAQTGNKLWSVAVGTSSRNIVIVAAYSIQIQVDASNLAQVEPELKTALEGLAQQVGGSMQGDITQTSVSGLPALRGTVSENLDSSPFTLDTTFAFQGSSEYQIACQYDAADATEITSGCSQVLNSFHV
jgi:hypothetical protein